MSDWNALLAAINQRPQARKVLSAKGKLRDFQNHPTHFFDVQNNTLQQPSNLRWAAAVQDTRLPHSLPQDDFESLLQSHLKGVGLQVIASGAYGIACKLPPGQARFLEALWQHASLRIGDNLQGATQSNEQLVVKFVRVYDKKGTEDTLRETRLQNFVSSSKVKGNPGFFPDIDGSSIVPALYFGCLIQIDGKWWFTTVMAMAAGEPLNKFLKKKPLTASVYAAVEKSIYSMWLIGVAHADFHLGNIMYHAASNKVTVIDLGFAVKLPQPIVHGLRLTASVAADAASVYDGTIAKYVSSVIYARGGTHQFAWFNPDGRVLSFMYNNITNKQQLAAARIHVWTSLTLKQARLQIEHEISRRAQIPAYYPPFDAMDID